VKTYIYGLSIVEEKDAPNIRYVGKTIDPAARLAAHLKDDGKTHKAHWIKKALRAGFTIHMTILEEVEELDDTTWRQKEADWIAFVRECGNKPVNIMHGGEGPSVALYNKVCCHCGKHFRDRIQYIYCSEECGYIVKVNNLRPPGLQPQDETVSRPVDKT